MRRALAVNPPDLNVLMEMAALRQAQGRPAEALDYLRQHEALAPGDHHTLVEQGRSLIDLGRLAEAEAVLRRAVVVRDAAAEYNLGVGARSAGPLGRGAGALRARAGHRSVPRARDEQPRRRARSARPDRGRRSPSSSGRIGDRAGQRRVLRQLRQRAHAPGPPRRCGAGAASRRWRWPRATPTRTTTWASRWRSRATWPRARDAFARALAHRPGARRRARQPRAGDPALR